MHTVLVIDDDEAARMLAAASLKRLGYIVLVARDAGEAVLLSEQHPEVDLLFSDVQMPGISGPGVLDILREVAGRGMRVLFTTGDVTIRELGHEILHKPYRLEALADCVRRALGS